MVSPLEFRLSQYRSTHLVSMLAMLLLPLVDTGLDLCPSQRARLIPIHDLGYARSFLFKGVFLLQADLFEQETTRYLLKRLSGSFSAAACLSESGSG